MTFLNIALEAIRASPLLIFTIATAIFLIARSIYRIYLHPISHIPGPLLPKITSLWLYYHAYIGDEATTIHKLHTKYGDLVRVSPHEVDISDADAIPSIYISKGGFPKAACYANFDIDGHKTIFSTTEHEYRAPRAKAVTPLFSTKAIRENMPVIYACVDRFVNRIKEEKTTGGKVNMLNLTRSLAVDVVSNHLFQVNYNGMSEKGERLSASAFVDAFVAVGRFFYLPNAVFAWAEWAATKWASDEKTDKSMVIVDKFVNDLVEKTTPESSTYPGRMLAAGLDTSEIKAQCKDLIFAGTDSTGMNLATILRNLVFHPDKLQKLHAELTSNETLGSEALDIQALPYLSAVVKEGLRTSMATPTRLPHIVPASGWNFKGTFFAPGTIVGCSAYELHFNPHVFCDPHAFIPERWLDASEEMNKYWFAFGAGSRACIARNLATVELLAAVKRLVMSGELEGGRAVGGEVKILEWFNSKVKGERIDLVWS